MYTRKEYSIIALAESLKRGGDQRKARFERSLSGMTLELLGKADRGPGEAIPSVSFSLDLEVGSQAGGQAIVSNSVLPVAAAARPQTILEKAGATVIDLTTISGTNLPVFSGNVTSSCWIGHGCADRRRADQHAHRDSPPPWLSSIRWHGWPVQS